MDKSKKRLEVLPVEGGDDVKDNSDETSLTFILKDEDHTLGNALRYIISLNPQVQHCGYSVPHPSVHDINFRIQTYGVPAAEVFKKGLEDLHSLCEHIGSTFEAAMKKYEQAKQDEIESTLEAMDA